MSLVIDAIQQFAEASTRRIAIVQQARSISYRELWDTIQFWRIQLRKSGAQTAACCVRDRQLALEIDLACQAAGIASLVLPSDCSADIVRQLVRYNGIESVLTDRSDLFETAELAHQQSKETGLFYFISPVLPQKALPASCAILSLDPIPKARTRLLSVSQQTIAYTTKRLAKLRDELGIERHLSLPFAPSLSEMLSGQYATFMTGGCCILPKQSSVRHLGKECVELIDDYAHSLVTHDIQSALIPAKCQHLFLQFAEEKAAAVASLKMILVAAQTPADLPDIETTANPQPIIHHRWRAPGHGLTYTLLRPATQYARVLPHHNTNIGRLGLAQRLRVQTKSASCKLSNLMPA